jgi:uncharacterized membrane protein YfcA
VLLALSGGLVAAGAVKGLIGVGMPIVAVPLLAMIIDIKSAVALLSIPLFLSNIPQAVEGGRVMSAVRSLTPVLLGLAPGLILGVNLLLMSDPNAAKILAGIALVAVGTLLLAAPKFKVPTDTAGMWGAVVGFAAGVIGGLAAISGPFVFAFLIAKGERGKQFTQQASLFLVISSAILAIVLSGNKTLPWRDFLISMAATIPVVAGMILGQGLRDKLHPDVFRRFVLVIIVLAGVELAGRAILNA